MESNLTSKQADGSHAVSYIIEDHSIPTKIRLLDESQPVPTAPGHVQVMQLYKSEPNIFGGDIQHVTIGKGTQDISMEDSLNILFVGQTGTGKTTVVNSIINYLYGVDYNDTFRFQLVSNGDDRLGTSQTQAESQTQYISIYNIPCESSFPIPKNIKIIDTPGFGDTHGVDQDKKIVDQIERIFKNEETNDKGQKCGVEYINAVAIVVKASDTRLTEPQKYIFSSILQIFGKEIEENIIIIVTNADSSTPGAFASLEKYGIPTKNNIIVNNVAFFGDKTDPFQAATNQIYWNLAITAYGKFLSIANSFEAKSLVNSFQVLKQRKNLFEVLHEIQISITNHASKLASIDRQKQIVNENEDKINRNQKFETYYTEYEWIKEPLPEGQYSTNCAFCKHQTCHSRCYVDDKKDCSSMDSNGYCMVCKCHYSRHYNDRNIYKQVAVTKTSIDYGMKKNMEEGEKNKTEAEKIISRLQSEKNSEKIKSNKKQKKP